MILEIDLFRDGGSNSETQIQYFTCLNVSFEKLIQTPKWVKKRYYTSLIMS
jgi:hypothetical protein